ncbi:CBS domain-containing protein [Acidianus sulfidivorans JP7]|nr:CBS domain-containing protein [Acidianus sulfidivorans]AWR98067.2 CBS domain-containing protein [Acidianus sulfidivorans JP7]
MNIKQIMNKNLITIDNSATIKDAASKMREYNVSSVVMKEGDRIVGIITERDITKAVAMGKNYNDPASDIATTKIIRVEADKSLYEMMDMMSSYGVRHLVVTEKGKDIGIISMRDIVATLSILEAEESSY